MAQARSRGPSQRQLRMGENIRHVLATFFQRTEIRDPILDDVSITVSEVRVSPDGKAATAYVTALGRKEQQDAIVKALNRHAKFIRGALSRDIHLKHTPSLSFEADTAFDRGQAMDALMNSPHVRQDIEPGSSAEDS